MNVLVAGGTGLLGRQVCLHFARRGWDVTVLSRQSECPAVLSQYANIRLYQWDPRSIDPNWGSLFTPNTVLINLAGQNPGTQRWTESFKNDILSTRLQTIDCLKSVIQKYQPALYLQASATGIYGNHPVCNQITDTEDNSSFYVQPSEQGEKFRQEVCFRIENEASNACLNTKTKCGLLRLGIILSNEDGLYPYLDLATKFGCSRIGSGTQFMSWIHEADAAASIEFISKNHLDGVLNIVAPTLTTNEEIMNSIARVNGRTLWNYVPIPSLPFQLAMGESASLVLDSQPVLPSKLLSQNFRFLYPTIDEAIKDLVTKA